MSITGDFLINILVSVYHNRANTDFEYVSFFDYSTLPFITGQRT